MIRSFIAIKITPDEEFLDAFSLLKDQLSDEKINWVDTKNLHLTLKFLGNITEQELNNIQNELAKVKLVKPFKFHVGGIQLIKDLKNPRVIYSEIKAENNLFQLAEEIDLRLSKLGFERDKKFLPHLTLGRIKFLKRKDLLGSILNDLKNVYFQQAECNEFYLYKSTLTPSGPIYKVLKTYKL